MMQNCFVSYPKLTGGPRVACQTRDAVDGREEQNGFDDDDRQLDQLQRDEVEERMVVVRVQIGVVHRPLLRKHGHELHGVESDIGKDEEEQGDALLHPALVHAKVPEQQTD
jgi:hypothetical protein